MIRTAILAAFAAALSACGGDDPGSPANTSGVTVTGKVAGLTLAPKEAAFVAAAGNCGTATPQLKGSLLSIRATDTAGQCAAAQSGKAIKNTTSLTLTLLHLGASQPAAFAAGSYTVSTSPVLQPDSSLVSVAASLDKTDASCHSTVTSSSGGDGIQATGGTIKIDAVSASAVSGSFDLSFGSSGTLTGTFATSVCAVAIDRYCGTGAALVCQ